MEEYVLRYRYMRYKIFHLVSSIYFLRILLATVNFIIVIITLISVVSYVYIVIVFNIYLSLLISVFNRLYALPRHCLHSRQAHRPGQLGLWL